MVGIREQHATLHEKRHGTPIGAFQRLHASKEAEGFPKLGVPFGGLLGLNRVNYIGFSVFPLIRGTFLGVPRMRTIVFGVLYWDPFI